MLSLAIGWYFWTKKLLKTLTFSLKLEIRLLLTNTGGIIGVFLPLIKVFIMDQYVLLAWLGLFNFLWGWCRSFLLKIKLYKFISSAPAFCNLTWSATYYYHLVKIKIWFFFSISVLIWLLNQRGFLSVQIIFLFGMKLWKVLSIAFLKRYNCSLTFFIFKWFLPVDTLPYHLCTKCM